MYCIFEIQCVCYLLMIKFRSAIQLLLLILLSTTFICGHAELSSEIVSSELQTSSLKTSQQTGSCALNKAVKATQFAISYNRQEQVGVRTLLVLKNNKYLNLLKLLLFFVLVTFLFVGTSNETFFIYKNRIQYFISDLKIHLLSARAHPPTH